MTQGALAPCYSVAPLLAEPTQSHHAGLRLCLVRFFFFKKNPALRPLLVIKFDNLKALCDILDCTPNDLFDEYHKQ